MTTRGYHVITEKYYLRTGLRHSKTQLKNRWDQLKGLYSFWLWLNKQKGLGRANGTVVADEAFWRENTKNHSEWKKLQYGPPEKLDQLQQMYGHTTVDGLSSCIPGENMNEGEESDDLDEDIASPASGASKKRAGSTSTATSALKRGQSPMLKIMRGMWGTLQSNSVAAKRVLEGELRTESIKKAMNLVKECGAREGSVEHYMATKLFVKAENRDMFFTLELNEGRLSWLKRNCQDYGLY